MTQENKDLLFKDLCARLPYGVKVYNEPYTFDLDNFEVNSTISETILEIIKEGWKPYLRPMSSMTEEEEKEFVRFTSKSMHRFVCEATGNYHWFYVWEEEDWLNKKMFDYRGLIEKGLAIEAPEGMYKTE